MPVQAFRSVHDLRAAAHDLLIIRDDGVEVKDAGAIRERLIDQLVWSAVFGQRDVLEASRWLIRHLAPAMGAWPASIHDLYMAAGRDAYTNVTTPAINLRGVTYDLARTVFRAGHATETRQIILELARSEMGYTQQRPGEYASAVLAAAIKENWQGPVFIQGDHYQASQKAYASDPEKEIAEVRDLAIEAIAAGYGNIDIDASTLVDLSHETLAEQQALNYRHTAELTRAIRENEPAGMTISIGGEIGEVGKTNSTVEDLDAFMTGYLDELGRLSEEANTDLTGISKISVQTGTSHGGVVLPDGSIKEVSVDFETLAKLSDVAKHRYGMGGAVQHGASTLPEEAFDKFAAADAVEVHLATAFQNAIYDSDAFPSGLRDQIYAHLRANHADERTPDQTDEQFYYTTRKRGFGPFKRELWSLPESTKAEILDGLQPRFELIMRELRVAGQGHLIDEHIHRIDVSTQAPSSLRGSD
jgi:fructose/tagatose bisphosphate aldolase